uniref:ATPase, T2SS/T4P/T4SS family n=1 Tax=uncultured Vibrio sp. TaxID=114054 RepID=UPI0026016E73
YRPDRIIVGEVRGGEALELLKAWNTGHSGGVATIHADSALQGLSRLEQCVSEASPHLNHALIGSSVHALVFMGRNAQGQRQVLELVEVDGFDAKAQAYQTRTIWEAHTHEVD